ncbi:NAD(P)-dependent alcohol dehydrogenase [Actinomadura livida]|uniref:NAD(P)-dependent alcohol dehydrogenase n=1 Tax=Actinomadura livida TaxID=79909 RepID=A0A7W7MY60_9ACTN|nr:MULTISPECIES: NAD(P)-dependent alcohol dehydrogenase [Actinomadura]MBB4774470.1 NADPH:quinone reductase-like Zn-dependent oxidoreductase [Actinomadura catellatispora]GGT82309.1 NADPH:quinone oxidoreductase [Actinomadura livida]
MKAAVHSRYGPPEVVQISEVDNPSVGDKDVLVRVHATTVNRTDCAYRAAKPFFIRAATGIVRPRRKVLGTEFAGVVEAVGGGVTSFAVGDRVFGYNEGAFGTHAEYLSVPADGAIAAMPAGATFGEAAPGTEGSHYALASIRKTGLKAGQDALVYGATGAIGSAAVQLLKHHDVTVTAVCDTANLEMVRGLGADRVVDYTVEDFTADEQRYDVVIDAVGKTTFGQCRRLLKSGGIYVFSDLGPWWQNLALALITPLFRGKKVQLAVPRQDQEMVRYMRELIGSGRFRPVIDRRYPLDQIVDAYRYAETGQKIGNVIIDVVPPT